MKKIKPVKIGDPPEKYLPLYASLAQTNADFDDVKPPVTDMDVKEAKDWVDHNQK